MRGQLFLVPAPARSTRQECTACPVESPALHSGDPSSDQSNPARTCPAGLSNNPKLRHTHRKSKVSGSWRVPEKSPRPPREGQARTDNRCACSVGASPELPTVGSQVRVLFGGGVSHTRPMRDRQTPPATRHSGAAVRLGRAFP